MKTTILTSLITLLLSGCGSIGPYIEAETETQVNFSEYSNLSDSYVKRRTNLKVAETGLVSGSTLLYSANGNSVSIQNDLGSLNVIYPLWVNETEIDDVEFAIESFRKWREQRKPQHYLNVHPINEYVSEWMNGVTFKFGLFSDNQGEPFLSVCYEFTELDACTFTYMIDKQSVELLSNDLDKFKSNTFNHLLSAD
mgnify:CR=1 FL=1